MLTHDQIWAAIDALAENNQLTASGLARNSGLDPTSFNKSKRHTANGRQRWPSTESIAKALRATQVTVSEFFEFAEDAGAPKPVHRRIPDQNYPMPGNQNMPLVAFEQAGVGGFFDAGGFPTAKDCDEICFPADDQDKVYALEVTGNSMQPLYSEGDVLIIASSASSASVRKDDRIVFKTTSGKIMAKILSRKTAKQIEVHSGQPNEADTAYPLEEIEWIGRILWASQ